MYDLELVRIVVWRRERDSNPRYTFAYGTLAMYWFKPLTHPSEKYKVLAKTNTLQMSWMHELSYLQWSIYFYLINRNLASFS